MAELHSSRGCAFGDFDNDGDLDVLIVNLHEPPSLLRNDLSGSNRWLKVRLQGTNVKPQRNRGASCVTGPGLRPQAQEVPEPVQLSFLQRSQACILA